MHLLHELKNNNNKNDSFKGVVSDRMEYLKNKKNVGIIITLE